MKQIVIITYKTTGQAYMLAGAPDDPYALVLLKNTVNNITVFDHDLQPNLREFTEEIVLRLCKGIGHMVDHTAGFEVALYDYTDPHVQKVLLIVDIDIDVKSADLEKPVFTLL